MIIFCEIGFSFDSSILHHLRGEGKGALFGKNNSVTEKRTLKSFTVQPPNIVLRAFETSARYAISHSTPFSSSWYEILGLSNGYPLNQVSIVVHLASIGWTHYSYKMHTVHLKLHERKKCVQRPEHGHFFSWSCDTSRSRSQEPNFFLPSKHMGSLCA